MLLIVLAMLGWQFRISSAPLSTDSLHTLSSDFSTELTFLKTIIFHKNCFSKIKYFIWRKKKAYLWLASRSVTWAQFSVSLLFQANMERSDGCWNVLGDLAVEASACGSPTGKAYTHQFAEHVSTIFSISSRITASRFTLLLLLLSPFPTTIQLKLSNTKINNDSRGTVLLQAAAAHHYLNFRVIKTIR